jgi:hypothetical protein
LSRWSPHPRAECGIPAPAEPARALLRWSPPAKRPRRSS